MAVYLSIQNPYRATAREAGYLNSEKLVAEGYDGIIVQNGPEETYYVVFEPTQIKSATDNIGTFDAANPDIRYSSNTLADPLRNPKAAEAHDLFQNGLHFIAYANSPDYDPEVGKYLNGLERQARNIEVARKAERLFAAGVTPTKSRHTKQAAPKLN